MSVVVIGLNHRSVPLDLLERMTMDASRLPKALHDVSARDHIREVVVLSTCNRLEVYASAERFHGAYEDIRRSLSELTYVPPEAFGDHLYFHFDDEAVRHLFSVASGIDSAVVGESEVLGQVREAWELARSEGTAGTSLNLLFRHAVQVGKRARTETAIARSVASVSTAAVAMVAERIGPLAGRRALVLGAGEMGEGMVRALVDAGVTDVGIANRTWGRAVELADRVSGLPVRLAQLGDALSQVDVLLTGTGASSILLEHGDIERVMAARAGRALLVVDVAVPRDVDPAAGRVPGVELLDMDDLRAFAATGLAARRQEVAAVEAIVAEELERFRDETTARQLAPLISSLHDRAEAVRRAELRRSRIRLDGLDDDQLAAVDAVTRRIVAKLLHQPTVGLKGAAGTPRGERLAESLRELFEL